MLSLGFNAFLIEFTPKPTSCSGGERLGQITALRQVMAQQGKGGGGGVPPNASGPSGRKQHWLSVACVDLRVTKWPLGEARADKSGEISEVYSRNLFG